ncbi:amidohydrolase family protein [Janthinobacterium psychrotolerans]|uniref:Amidohydrolase 3 domain-containing protein n=1 Tax=Janthinobacterium psychrotolerans TaxID=1747903 RepID=A0A1A7C1M3_9BURK|nr:amidohydrolase family protein [Janthinobacterium psychrotolerans]OBV38635.1 hypothetical protein ASR47_1006236 [Janthinobacterium psychrotolerans]
MHSIFPLFPRLPGLARRRTAILAVTGALLCPASQAAPVMPGNYTLFKNANIVDMENGSSVPRAGQVLVRNGDILAIDTDAGMASWLREHQIDQVSNTIDLNGDILMPGFIEPHAHLAVMTQMKQITDISPCWPAKFETRQTYTGTAPNSSALCPLYINDAVKMVYADKSSRKGKWIVGNGIDPSRMTTVQGGTQQQTMDFINAPAAYFARNFKDDGSAPLFLLDQSGHIAYVNQLALQTALAANCSSKEQCPGVSAKQITSSRYQPTDTSALYAYACTKTPDVCNYTGRLLEPGAYTAFIAAMQQAMPKTQILLNETPDQFVLAAMPLANAAARAGITTFVNGGALSMNEVANLKALLTYTWKDPKRKTLRAPLRAVTLLAWNATDDSNTQQQSSVLIGMGRDIWAHAGQRFGIQGVKLWADGSTQGCSAALTKPYDQNGLCGDAKQGHINYQTDEIVNNLRPFWDQGWYVNVHTNGDHAIQNTMAAISKLGASCATSTAGACTKMHTLIHFTVDGNGSAPGQSVPPEVKRLMDIRSKNIDLSASFLIGHVAYWGAAFQTILDGVPKEDQNSASDAQGRAAQLDAARSLHDNKIPFSLHSDGPVSPTVPLWLAEQAVTRQTWVYPNLGTAGKSQAITMPGQQGISFHDALRAITVVPARQHQLFNRIGSIKAGKKADFVRLARQDYEAALLDPSKISAIKVIGTYLDGAPVDYFPTAQ